MLSIEDADFVNKGMINNERDCNMVTWGVRRLRGPFRLTVTSFVRKPVAAKRRKIWALLNNAKLLIAYTTRCFANQLSAPQAICFFI